MTGYLFLLFMNEFWINCMLNRSYKDYPKNPSNSEWNDYVSMCIMGGEL